MRSSWSWESDEEFEESIHPVHINPVRHVRTHKVIYSAAENVEELILHLQELREAQDKLRAVLKERESKANLNRAHDIARDICHHGEMLLLHQRWLAADLASGDFLNVKEAITHGAHSFYRETSYYDVHKLRDAIDELLRVYDRYLAERSTYLVYDVHDLPHPLEVDFREARDLFSLGFDEMGLFACGRGLEKVARAILDERAIKVSSKGRAVKASESDLFTVIECMDRLRWNDDSRFVGKKTSRLLHWVRAVRNEAAHPSDSDMEARQFAPVIAKATMSLWTEHKSNKGRALKETVLTL